MQNDDPFNIFVWLFNTASGGWTAGDSCYMCCDHLTKVRLKNKQFSLKIQITFSVWEESLVIAEILWNSQYFFTVFAYVLLHDVWVFF